MTTVKRTESGISVISRDEGYEYHAQIGPAEIYFHTVTPDGEVVDDREWHPGSDYPLTLETEYATLLHAAVMFAPRAEVIR